MTLTRRDFLKLIAASAVVSAAPAFCSTRSPYVTVKSNPVSYIGACTKGEHQFCGSKIVAKVHEWDGVGYPVDLKSGGYGVYNRLERYYDFELVDFQEELPDHFWWDEERNKKYLNVHTYIREKRFGETVFQAIEHMKYKG